MLNKIFENINNKIPMALIRYGDGEKNILDNITCERAGFSYNPNDIRDQNFRTELKHALQYNGGENYFVGVNDEELKKKVNGTIISPMIFVNQNYLEFLQKFKNVAKEIPIILVVNKLSQLTNMPFNFTGLFHLNDNAWHKADYLYEGLLGCLDTEKKTTLVLVAGGAYSCILIHKIWQRNQNHILLDIGSTLDPWLFGKYTRQYHQRLNK